MHYLLKSHRLFLITGFWFVFIAGDVIAQNSNSGTSTTAPSPVPQTSVETKLQEYEQRLKKLEKPSKDSWDKLASISGLVSGGLVALIGLSVTSLLNKRR